MSSRSLPLRFVVVHIHPTSARLRFLMSPDGYVVQPKPLPQLAELLEQKPVANLLTVHPSAYVRSLCRLLNIRDEMLQVASEFRCWVDVPGRCLPVYLLQTQSVSPFAVPEGWLWIELPDAFQLLPIERLVLRRIYDFLLGHEAV